MDKEPQNLSQALAIAILLAIVILLAFFTYWLFIRPGSKIQNNANSQSKTEEQTTKTNLSSFRFLD